MKRLFDFIVASIILIILSPLLIFIMLLILCFQGKEIFFTHPRLGKNHYEFRIIKFCTMSNQKDEEGKLLPDKERTSGLGGFLRRTSLDELPGFWNVLKGEMSIVGPRPLPPQYLNRYSKEQDRRHAVKPGVTGWAQINGRNAISWDKKFLLDAWYVDNQSFYLDCKILISTFSYVLLRKEIVPDDKDSMEEFMGNKTGE